MTWRLYWPAARRLRETGLACLGAGRIDHEPERAAMAYRTLGCHGLVLITAGGGWFSTRADSGRTGPRVAVSAPSLIWLFPGIPHAYGPGPDGWSERWVLYEGVAVTGYAAYGLHDPAAPVVPVPASAFPPAVDQVFDELAALRGRSGLDAQLIAATGVHRLLGLARTCTRPVAGTARSLVDRLTESCTEDLSVARRAERIGVSAAELRDQVRRETGLTPHELIVRTRIARAQHLLSASELGIAEIGRSVGYDDPAYFSRLFTRRTGMSPRAFRQLP